MRTFLALVVFLPLLGCASVPVDQDAQTRAAITDTEHDLQCRREGRSELPNGDYGRCMKELAAQDGR
jgi:hypothetical protein